MKTLNNAALALLLTTAIAYAEDAPPPGNPNTVTVQTDENGHGKGQGSAGGDPHQSMKYPLGKNSDPSNIVQKTSNGVHHFIDCITGCGPNPPLPKEMQETPMQQRQRTDMRYH